MPYDSKIWNWRYSNRSQYRKIKNDHLNGNSSDLTREQVERFVPIGVKWEATKMEKEGEHGQEYIFEDIIMVLRI